MKDYELAMVELSAAFGHGVRMANRKTWTPEAGVEGHSWLATRLKASNADWSKIRVVALELAEKAGRFTATFRDADTQGNKSVIQKRHLCRALKQFRASCDPQMPTFLGDDCPF